MVDLLSSFPQSPQKSKALELMFPWKVFKAIPFARGLSEVPGWSSKQEDAVTLGLLCVRALLIRQSFGKTLLVVAASSVEAREKSIWSY